MIALMVEKDERGEKKGDGYAKVTTVIAISVCSRKEGLYSNHEKDFAFC